MNKFKSGDVVTLGGNNHYTVVEKFDGFSEYNNLYLLSIVTDVDGQKDYRFLASEQSLSSYQNLRDAA